ncbi:IclR family transcriptional regulator [Pseudomonas cavernicola]|uniref:IclR family transcriptional regulator n=1 Tax=Pseudomonas cavernicola TaxID=2320866 RepID=A0A418XM63_9PSED|nr:IclR family transcriptional regulator [Pseudomonas cavernicola]RJG13535.1 IclR family transcriptional regulator [Pseudomonas cavernicola]
MSDMPLAAKIPIPRDRNGIQVIARAAEILRALEGAVDGVGVGELASRVKLSRSTVDRIVAALAKEELLIPAARKASVKLGPALIRLGASAQTCVDQVAKPVMEELSRALNETVELSILSNGTAVVIQQITAAHRLQAVSTVGESFPLHCSASGKALLALLNAHQLARHLKLAFTQRLFDNAQLEADLEQVRREQVAWDFEEHQIGVCALATAFLDLQGYAYALSIPVPTARFREKMLELTPPLLAARESLLRLVSGRART